MIRSNGAKLLYTLARTSLLRSSLPITPPSQFRSSLLSRGFFSGLTNVYQTPQKSSFQSNPSLSRFIHATRSTSEPLKCYYDVLGVSKSAPQSELKQAYYKLAKELHPDVNKDDPDAQTKFAEVQKAYEALKDEEKRSLYDQVGREGFERGSAGGGGFGGGAGGFGGWPGGFPDLNDIFRAPKGEDVMVSLQLSFMEAIQGCTKTLNFQADLPCQACGGSGVPPGTRPETCKACKGAGVRTIQNGHFRLETNCGQCGGSGLFVNSFCKLCKGERVVRGSKTVKLDVMAGIDDNDTIKVSRSGGADPDGNQPGDLFVTIKIKEDPVFQRQGRDIHVNTVLSISKAILGGSVEVPTLTGDVCVKVRPGTQSGQKVVLKKKGIRARNSPVYGDQFVHFNVTIPTNLTEKQRSLIEEFAKEEERKGENEDVGSTTAAASG